jgi:hypothetical protein
MGVNARMSNSLTPQVLAQLFNQESNDPFLTLVTLSHAEFSTIRLVNNTEDIVSNGNTFIAFPMRIVLPADDGEKAREITIEFDNVGLDLIDAIREVTSPIDVKLEMILASLPDDVQYSFEELKIQNLSYSKTRIAARLFLDSFLNTEITSERYTPTNYPGLF